MKFESGFDPPSLLTPAEVASILRVDPKTVLRWANKGILNSIRLPGGHRRYFAEEVQEFFETNYDKIQNRSNHRIL